MAAAHARSPPRSTSQTIGLLTASLARGRTEAVPLSTVRHAPVTERKRNICTALAVASTVIDTQRAFRFLNTLIAPAVAKGFFNPLPVGIGPVVVETTGRKSGLARRVPLLSVRVGDRIYVSTIRPDSQWAANLAASPKATVRLFGRDRIATSESNHLGPLRVAKLQLTDQN